MLFDEVTEAQMRYNRNSEIASKVRVPLCGLRYRNMTLASRS